MDKIYTLVEELTDYALNKGFIKETDRFWARNNLLRLLGLKDFKEPKTKQEPRDVESILNDLTDYAVEAGLIDESITERDLFDTLLIGELTPKPSEVIEIFSDKYNNSKEEATDWYYDFSQDTNYIRRERIKKDRKWKTKTPYGELDITINLSKPEKDPKAIAQAGKQASTSYPLCQLCPENIGYEGRLDHPARENHRIIPIDINGEDWYFQYSPYVYYNEHCIVLNSEHVPMVIDRSAFNKLFDFIDQFPHYFVGSNADLPIVGGSILSHEHFQGGHYTFAIENADVLEPLEFEGYEDVKAGILNWPLSVIRLESKDREKLTELADKILKLWREYSDESVGILAYTDETPHNTITPIARKHGDLYELDLVLRNNRTSQEHPLGIYHPHQEYHHIKKENIGLIEVMGLAVLPARLKNELETVKKVLVEDLDVKDYPEIEVHEEWITDLRKRYPKFTSENIDAIIEDEVGQIFSHVLENCGVYKLDETGQKAFKDFIDHVNENETV